MFTRFLRAWILPPGGCLVLFLAAYLLLTRARRPAWAQRLAVTGLIILYVFSLDWIPALMVGLYSRHPAIPPEQLGSQGAQAIVALGGGRKGVTLEYGRNEVTEGTLVRVRYAAFVQRKTGLPLLLSGGGTPSEAEAMSYVAREMGVPEERLWLEESSTTTLQNARCSAEILQRKNLKRILLVTHNLHMRRAARVFEQCGLEVVAAPCEAGTRDGTEWTPLRFVPRAHALYVSSYVLEELLGSAYYALRGR